MALSRFAIYLVLTLWANSALGLSPVSEPGSTAMCCSINCDCNTESSSSPLSCPVPIEDEDRDEEEGAGNEGPQRLGEVCDRVLMKGFEPTSILEKACTDFIGRPPEISNA